MNAAKKSLKVKGFRERTTLIEFLVKKRTSLLEYLKELHSTGGAFWMNTILLNADDIYQHFNVSKECILHELHSETPFEEEERPLLPMSEAWEKRYLPYLMALGMTLSDYLLAPLSSAEFAECVLGALLELDVAYASGPAKRTIALHNLNSFRCHFSSALNDALVSSDLSAGETPNAERPCILSRYLFLQPNADEYCVSSGSYDAVIPPLCAILETTYKKLCDFEAIQSVEATKRILSIDKHLEKVFFSRITGELEVIAHEKLIHEAKALSVEGLFSGFAEGVGDASDFALTCCDSCLEGEQRDNAPEQSSSSDD